MALDNQRNSVYGKATNLRELRIRCKMDALKRAELDAFFVDTKPGRDPHSSIRKSLTSILEDAKDSGMHAKVLVYGHGGCGKSTELVKLSDDLCDEFFTIRFSINESGNAFAISPEEIILLLAEQIIRYANEESELAIDERPLEGIYDYFKSVTTEETKTTTKTAEVTAGADSSYKTKLVNLLASVKTNIIFSTERREKVVSELKKQSSALLENLRLLINAINNALNGKRELLVIIEDLDKLDIAQARKLFVEEGAILSEVPTHTIYTIPVFLVRSEDATVLDNRYATRLTLPMIKTLEQDGKTRSEQGFNIIREIIHKRIDESLIEEEALNLLIEKTGGLLQHTFDILHTAALLDDSTVPLNKVNIQVALDRKKTRFWSEIGVPDSLAERLTIDDLYQRLRELARNQLEGKSNPPKSDLINQILMKQAAVIQYNGEGWLGVHPLVMENLHARGDIYLNSPNG